MEPLLTCSLVRWAWLTHDATMHDEMEWLVVAGDDRYNNRYYGSMMADKTPDDVLRETGGPPPVKRKATPWEDPSTLYVKINRGNELFDGIVGNITADKKIEMPDVPIPPVIVDFNRKVMELILSYTTMSSDNPVHYSFPKHAMDTGGGFACFDLKDYHIINAGDMKRDGIQGTLFEITPVYGKQCTVYRVLQTSNIGSRVVNFLVGSRDVCERTDMPDENRLAVAPKQIQEDIKQSLRYAEYIQRMATDVQFALTKTIKPIKHGMD